MKFIFQKNLKQSSLSRLYDYTQSCDVGFVFAYKNKNWIIEWVQQLKTKILEQLNSFDFDEDFIELIQKITTQDLYDWKKSQRIIKQINRFRMWMLEKDIKSSGCPYFKADGHYENQFRKSVLMKSKQENGQVLSIQDKSKYTDKQESFVLVNTAHFGGFSQFVHKLGNLYNQQSVMIVYAGGNKIQFIYDTGKIEKHSKMKFGKDSSFKTLVNGRPFVAQGLSQLINPIIKSSSMKTKRFENIWQEIN